MKRLVAVWGILMAAVLASRASADTLSVAAPVITEPSVDGQVISPFDVHMVAGPFVGDPGETHVCSDWEIRTIVSDTVVWTAPCVTGTLAVHIHLGDGAFVGLLAGRRELNADEAYRLRVRFEGSSNGGEWSDWSARLFHTTPATQIGGLILSDVAAIPAPRWRDDSGQDLTLPSGVPAADLRLEVPPGGTLLAWRGAPAPGDPQPENFPALSVHGPLRIVCDAGGNTLSLPSSHIDFTDGSGQDRQVFLPPISLTAGQTAAWWIAESGGSFTDRSGGAADAVPDYSDPVAEPPVPWAVKQPGYRVDRFVTDLQLPVNIAFVPSPGRAPDDPFFYVTELYGAIKVVARSGASGDFATDLLNFDPTGSFPGSGEKGLTGITIDPQSGDVFASKLFATTGVTDFHFPEVVRFHSLDGGHTAASQTTILHFPDEPSGASHQISNLSMGPDGKLYVHVGDGLLTTPAQDMNSVRGKILRVNLDGSAPPDNPFYDAADGLTSTDLVFALGFRNPFGGAWRTADGSHWEVENGPSVDRIARVVAGRNYGWDGSDASMHTFAAYNWPIAVAPVNIAFVEPATFSGSGFPADKMDHAFVAESGPTYGLGPQAYGKRVSEFVFDLDGNLVSGPLPLIEYVGAGRGTATALAAGPDGLYFADLYKDFGATVPTERGASVFRIRWVGIANFYTTLTPAGAAPLSVEFHDASDVPATSAWHWEFGDGAVSDEPDPVHVYLVPGSYDVRLTVTGAAGPVSVQKPSIVTVGPAVRQLTRGLVPARPAPRVLPPR